MKFKSKYTKLSDETSQEEVIMENAQKNNDLVKTIFKGVGVAMGIAVIVLSVLGTATPTTLITLLGIGLFCLAVVSLQ